MEPVFTKDIIKCATLPQLAEMYNIIAEEVGEKPVNRFADKTSGKRRLAAILKRKPSKKALPKKEKKQRSMNFNLKGDKVAKFLRGPKKDGSVSTRLKLARILEKGGTFDLIVKKVWADNHRSKSRSEKWKRKNTYGDIHLLNVECGYGVVEKDGFIQLDRAVQIKGQ